MLLYSNLLRFRCRKKCSGIYQLCRGKLTVLGAELKWDSPVWKGIAIFRKLDTGCGTFKDEYLLDKNFVDFAKSYIRYQQALNPVKKHGTAITVLKCTEKALYRFIRMLMFIILRSLFLMKLCRLQVNIMEKNFLYKCGYEIEKLAKFLSEYHFVKCGFLGWVNRSNPILKIIIFLRKKMKTEKINYRMSELYSL